MKFKTFKTRIHRFLYAAFLVFSLDNLEAQTTPPQTITLSNLVQQVIERNEALQAKLLEWDISRSRHRAEKGIFEPEAFASANRELINRPNSSEQAAAANGIPVLLATNNIYQGGIEALAPVGTRIRLGYTMSDLRNNIPTVPIFGSPFTNNQWQTFLGFSATQPLLKNFGFAASMASIRVAAISSRIAFQDYRRQLMALVSSAEAAYWGLYLAQEQVRFFEESVKTAETILQDHRARFEAGKVSELEVHETESAAGLRRAKLNEAKQKVVEAVNRLLLLYAEVPQGPGLQIQAVDVPQVDAEPPNWLAGWQAAFESNPDYLAQREKLQQELIRLGYAKNQRLPELDLKGAYGLNGFGFTPSDSWTALESQNFPSWSIGVELRIPLGGGVKSRNELKAVKSQVQVATLALRTLEREIFTGMDTSRHKVQSSRQSVDNYQSSVNYNESLLKSALTRLEAGKLDSRRVLEIEAELFEARNSVVESLVRYKIAQLELELIQGTTLLNRNLEVTTADLKKTLREMEQEEEAPIETSFAQ